MISKKEEEEKVAKSPLMYPTYLPTLATEQSCWCPIFLGPMSQVGESPNPFVPSFKEEILADWLTECREQRAEDVGSVYVCM